MDGVQRVSGEESQGPTTQTLKDLDPELHFFASSHILLWQEVPLQL